MTPALQQEIRELLPLAARACEYVEVPAHRYGIFRVRDKSGLEFDWHPMSATSGDGAAMENTLEIGVNWGVHYVLCVGPVDTGYKRLSFESTIPSVRVYYTETSGDKGLARRLAALRCAAELGRKMGGAG